jgi:hypothetical protein
MRRVQGDHHRRGGKFKKDSANATDHHRRDGGDKKENTSNNNIDIGEITTMSATDQHRRDNKKNTNSSNIDIGEINTMSATDQHRRNGGNKQRRREQRSTLVE